MKNIFLIFILITLILNSGCKSENTESEPAEFSSQISSSVTSSHITEFETKSDTDVENSTELRAKIAQGSETASTVNAKATVPQSEEAKSVVEVNNNPPAFASEDKDTAPVKNADAADTREVADKVIFYLNEARAAKGSGELTKLPGLTRYAEYRSGQLISNFAHDPNDWNRATEVTGYGKYIDLSEIDGASQGYYDIGAREALAMAGLAGSTEKIAETLAQIIIASPRHWAYVGSDEMKYTAVGVSLDSNMWYAAILVTNTTEYEN